MPIPTPKKNEKKQKFVSRCIAELSATDIKLSAKQVVAICYDKWDKKESDETTGDNSEN